MGFFFLIYLVMGKLCFRDSTCGKMKCLIPQGQSYGLCMCSAYATGAYDSYCLADNSADGSVFEQLCNGWLYSSYF